MTETQKGYLDNDYLTENYGAGQVFNGGGFQVSMLVNKDKSLGAQISQRFEGNEKVTGLQTELKIEDSKTLGMQTEAISLGINGTGIQTKLFVEKFLNDLGMSVRLGHLAHYIREVYLNEGGYLEDSYLSYAINATQGMQVLLFNKKQSPYGMQVNQAIGKLVDIGMQTLLIINKEEAFGIQVNKLRAQTTGMQATLVLYNTTQLRLMYAFPSRGTPALAGVNWTASSTRAGDFSANNLNTDIIEQRWQSEDGNCSYVTLTCNTGLSQGAYLDTLAILDHNFTKSAGITLQGSNDNFATVSFSTVLTVELENMFYIAPALPTAGYQYWRFIIQDTTNPDTYLRIGTLVFGSSKMFTMSETFQNPVSYGSKHFKDSLETEGFTAVSNDRATRKNLGLSFSQLQHGGANYRMLTTYFKTAKTDLKCLIIPLPESASAFAIFSKLYELPNEQHTADTEVHVVDLELAWDESL